LGFVGFAIKDRFIAGHPIFKLGFGYMRDIIKLESTAGTGYFYTTTKNKKLHSEKLEVNKFDPKIRKYVKFVEKKISK